MYDILKSQKPSSYGHLRIMPADYIINRSLDGHANRYARRLADRVARMEQSANELRRDARTIQMLCRLVTMFQGQVDQNRYENVTLFAAQMAGEAETRMDGLVDEMTNILSTVVDAIKDMTMEG
ncbi:hypothetical protein MBLNU457_7838t1 [Dothideomycetes sp. NU457]